MQAFVFVGLPRTRYWERFNPVLPLQPAPHAHRVSLSHRTSCGRSASMGTTQKQPYVSAWASERLMKTLNKRLCCSKKYWQICRRPGWRVRPDPRGAVRRTRVRCEDNGEWRRLVRLVVPQGVRETPSSRRLQRWVRRLRGDAISRISNLDSLPFSRVAESNNASTAQGIGPCRGRPLLALQ